MTFTPFIMLRTATKCSNIEASSTCNVNVAIILCLIKHRKSNKKNWDLQEKGRKDCNKRNKIDVFPPENLHFSYKSRIFAEI